ncbi:MAG: hypothetical protein ACLFWB_13525, partial [Armatimonadota bacterium]
MSNMATTIITVVVIAALSGAAVAGTPATQQVRHDEAGQAAEQCNNSDIPDDVDLDWRKEKDPFQRSAKKALSGEYGELAFWQRAAYIWGIKNGVTCDGLAKVTSYGYRWEPRWLAGGKWTASGSHVHLAGCAANPEIPFGVLVWTPYGLRYV